MGNFGDDKEGEKVNEVVKQAVGAEEDRRDLADTRRGLKSESFKGLLEEGNIDLQNRPKIKNADQSESTVRTITTEIDGKTILLPTVINGKIVSNQEAVEHYKKTGEHMGKFKDEEAANEYDKIIHQQLGWTGKKNKWD